MILHINHVQPERAALASNVVSTLVSLAGDPQIPLLIWWAMESKAISDRDQVVGLFSEPSIWRRALALRGRLATGWWFVAALA